jgi:hypothetical protein
MSVWVVDPGTKKPVEINGKACFQGEARSVVVNPAIESREYVLVLHKDVPVGSYVITEGNERVRPAGPGKPAVVYWPAEDDAPRAASRR